MRSKEFLRIAAAFSALTLGNPVPRHGKLTPRKPSGKNRDKVKAARKQSRNSKKR